MGERTKGTGGRTNETTRAPWYSASSVAPTLAPGHPAWTAQLARPMVLRARLAPQLGLFVIRVRVRMSIDLSSATADAVRFQAVPVVLQRDGAVYPPAAQRALLVDGLMRDVRRAPVSERTREAHEPAHRSAAGGDAHAVGLDTLTRQSRGFAIRATPLTTMMHVAVRLEPRSRAGRGTSRETDSEPEDASAEYGSHEPVRRDP